MNSLIGLGMITSPAPSALAAVTPEQRGEERQQRGSLEQR